MALFPDDDHAEVATKVTGSLDRWGYWDATWSVPTTSAITQAHKRLGLSLFPEFERTCGPVAGDVLPQAGLFALGTARGSFLRRWPCWPPTGSRSTYPDSNANAAEFGYSGSGDNRSAFPKAWVVALAECGTHAFVAAEVGAYQVGEKTLAARLYPRLRADELLTADRGFYSWEAWHSAAATGAALLWRAPTSSTSPSCACAVMARTSPCWSNRRCGVPDRDGNGSGELIVLLTTILDPMATTGPAPTSSGRRLRARRCGCV